MIGRELLKRGRDIIVFDLDGTLADGTHREHHLHKRPKDWETYFALCHLDAPCGPLVDTYRALLGDGHFVEIWTGRIAETRVATEEWIKANLGPTPDRLRMRPVGDRTDDNELKRLWLAEARAAGDQVILVFEDRRRVVEMWRAEGIVCAQVAEGDF
jgi:hypothetical protein